MTEQLRELDQIGQDVGRSFGDAFESFVTGAESASEAVKALGRDLLQMSIRKGFTEPLAEGFGSLFRNMFGGAVTSGAAVIPHAQGGVISSPIMFPLNGHRVGVAGEAGPEAIMPLTRGSDGKLGVQASQSGNVAVTNHFHISTPDANSFRRSRNQIAADMRAASRRAAGGL
jgi:phage-related minor tail protein